MKILEATLNDSSGVGLPSIQVRGGRFLVRVSESGLSGTFTVEASHSLLGTVLSVTADAELTLELPAGTLHFTAGVSAGGTVDLVVDLFDLNPQ